MPLPFVSLIPKKEEKFNLAKILSILFYISIFLVLVSLGLLFFFDNSVKKANKNLGDLEQTFTSQKSPEFLKLEQDVLDSKQKIRDFETISAQHRFTLNIFTALEKSTHPKVWFSAFELIPLSFKVSLTGEASDFKTLGEQILIFKENTDIKDASLSEAILNPKGIVEFKLQLTFNPQVFSYRPSETQETGQIKK